MGTEIHRVVPPAARQPSGPPQFPSVLFRRVEESVSAETVEEPSFFRDLNLEQVVAGITGGWSEYHLQPYFHVRPGDIASVVYRQEVMKELDTEPVMAAVGAFTKGMRLMRDRAALAAKRHYRWERERTFLGAIELYCQVVRRLGEDLEGLKLRSRGLRAMREYLREYLGWQRFEGLDAQQVSLRERLDGIRYDLLLRGDIEVRVHEEAEDYNEVIERIFERFRRGAVKGVDVELRTSSGMNHIEAEILDRVARLNPETFQELEAFCVANGEFVDEGISRFDREVLFYVTYLRYIHRFREAGLPFCYPRLSDSDKGVECRDTFDLALAARQVNDGARVVTNDFQLRDRERVFVVTGPNQDGKTTFARTFGQLHYLAALGCPVPGTDARLFFFDRIYTHFEREEVAANLRGKLHDDLVRLRAILEEATSSSIVILNEAFASTTVKDAVFLGTEVMGRLCRLDALAVCVTFLSELATMDPRAVSMTSMIDPDDPAIRTFKVLRRPATGLAYALAVARRHRVTYEQLKERLSS